MADNLNPTTLHVAHSFNDSASEANAAEETLLTYPSAEPILLEEISEMNSKLVSIGERGKSFPSS